MGDNGHKPDNKQEQPGQQYYCEACGKETWHTRSEEGDFEVFRCTICGNPHTVKTR